MTSILITGAGGFVGQYLVPACLDSMPGANIHAWVLGTRPSFPASVKLTSVDLLDFEKTKLELGRIKPDIIMHLAGQSGIAKSFIEPAATFHQNTQTTFNLVEACRVVSPHTVFFMVSSGDVYGNASNKGELTEATLPEPLNFYAVSKLSAELITQSYTRNFGLKTIILRPFNHIGANMSPGFAISDFARQIAKIEQNQMAPIMRVGNLQVERDILTVQAVVRAYIALMQAADSLSAGDIIQICSGKSRKIIDLLDELLAMSKVSITVEVDPQKLRSHDITRVIASNEKLKQLCPSWSSDMDLGPCLQSILNHFRKQENQTAKCE